MVEQGGKTANTQGAEHEDRIEAVLVSRGYVKLSDKEKAILIRQDGIPPIQRPKWFARHAGLVKNLYGARWRLDFYVVNNTNFQEGLSIEVKWQGSQGSVDEKYVFTVMSMEESIDGHKMIILAGPGARQGARQWIKKYTSKKQKWHQFQSTDDFIHWANKNL